MNARCLTGAGLSRLPDHVPHAIAFLPYDWDPRSLDGLSLCGILIILTLDAVFGSLERFELDMEEP